VLALVVNTALALVPVLLFLTALQVMDSFQLVRPRSVFLAISAGAAAALVCLALYDPLGGVTGVSAWNFSRYIAPAIEEIAKSAFVAFIIARRRVGFLVDAAVIGFAVGAGFGLVENIHYLYWGTSDAPMLLWLIRGLGTAMLHGATSCIFAMISKPMADRAAGHLATAFAPGLLTAIVIHSAFNHVLLPPLAMTLLLVAVLPALILVVFQRSEAATRDWIGAGLDLDIELLELVTSEHFTCTRLGQYLQELKERFAGPVVADMFCLLRVELELSVQARAMVMAREAGVAVPIDDDLHACLAELEHLHASIGRTGMLALKPLQLTGHRDRWHKYLMTEAARDASSAADR
jgi:RsiW-degrading membrane proteinase PrsW (M82 family)